MRYIICDYAFANWGKTATLKEASRLLQMNHQGRVVNSINVENDICELIEVLNSNGVLKTVAVVSVGDPNSNQMDCLDWAVSNYAEIIICAARSYGSTVNHVYQAQTSGNYIDIIWTRNLYFENSAANQQHLNIANTYSAESIVNLTLHLL